MAITLLPDTAAIDSTLARVHNPFIQKKAIKKNTSSSSHPLPHVSQVTSRSRFPKFLFTVAFFVIAIVIFVGILYFSPFLRAKILP